MHPIDIAILAVIAATLFFSIRSLVRANKNGCSDCGAACSSRDSGHCSKAGQMLADANKAFAQRGLAGGKGSVAAGPRD